MENANLQQEIQQTIGSLGLNLSGKTVLTEAASGAYCVTPLIAGMAGAKVIAYGKSTRYGAIEDVFAELNQRRQAFDLKEVELIDELKSEHIAVADIITNSGHLRPLNDDKLQHAKDGAVISLMYEAWELRDSDIDLSACRQRKISVGGLNERHTAVGVFEYLGDMARVLLERAGKGIRDEKIVLICNNEFGPYIAKTLCGQGAQLAVMATPTHRERYPQEATWLDDQTLSEGNDFEDAESIVFTAYPFDQVWISEYGPYPIAKLKKNFPNAQILRFAGDVDTAALDAADVSYFPKEVAKGHMGVLPSDVGFAPVIRLQAGGLRVGQAMLEQNFDVNGQQIGSFLNL